MSEQENYDNWEEIFRVRDKEEEQIPHTDKVAYYNTNVSTYEDAMAAGDYSGPRMTAELLHKYLNGRLDAKILDVGGGTGLVVKELKKLAPYNNVDGLDPAEGMLTVAKESGLYNNIFPQFFTLESDVPSNSYDALSCCGAFIPDHIKAEVVTKMCDIVKPGGYVVIGMRKQFADNDCDLKLLRPLVHKLADTKQVELMEECVTKDFFNRHDGLKIVLRKLC
ncbi:ubiquinone biosynthesis O-methyltransferase-like [Watersipora subatra]|uniref:ubiquinone biosynthesis O-methyltransferase-like n=1 Tax=Watersipora subatra TaxID=2589382 RepID=UPI00355B57E1